MREIDEVRSWTDSLPKLVGITAAAAVVVVVATAGWMFENVSADNIVIIQGAVDGKLHVYTQPGLAFQNFGYVATYDKRGKYDFMPASFDKAGKPVGGIPIRFNDGSHGTIFGSIQFKLSASDEKLKDLRYAYKDQSAIDADIFKKVTNNAIYLAGTLMTAKESYAEKRNDLIHYVLDQVQNGIYRTKQVRKYVKDEVTGETKEVIAAEIVMENGQPARQEKSVLNDYDIQAYNFLIDTLPYDDAVEKQIEQQRQIQMDVQTSIAEKLKQEQLALTAGATGQANAAKAEWEAKTVKVAAETKAEQEKSVAVIAAKRAKEVAETEGNQRLTVAELNKKTAETEANQKLLVADFDKRVAEQRKSEQILMGEGESARKKLVIEADGALEQKLAAYVKVQEAYAKSLTGANLVPLIGGGSGKDGQSTAGSNIDQLVSIMSAMAARNLQVDMNMMGQPKR